MEVICDWFLLILLVQKHFQWRISSADRPEIGVAAAAAAAAAALHIVVVIVVVVVLVIVVLSVVLFLRPKSKETIVLEKRLEILLSYTPICSGFHIIFMVFFCVKVMPLNWVPASKGTVT